MKEIRFAVLALFVASLLYVGAAAQSTASDVPATREDIVRLFHQMHVQEQTRAAMDAMLKQQRVMARESIRKHEPEASEEELKKYDAFMDSFIHDLSIDQMIDEMIPVYQKHLTKGDVDAMNAFYASPTGQKLLREMPAIMNESMQAMMPRMQETIDKMTERAEKMAREGREKKAPSTPPAAPPGKN